jgi:hypothetical protein
MKRRSPHAIKARSMQIRNHFDGELTRSLQKQNKQLKQLMVWSTLASLGLWAYDHRTKASTSPQGTPT